METLNTSICFGILCPGDMGQAIAKELLLHNYKVITASEGRSESTKKRISEIGITDVKAVKNVVEQADYILNLTNAASSVAIAQLVAKEIEFTKRKPIYVDLNSNNPKTALQIKACFDEVDSHFINAAVLGIPNNVKETAKIIVSGKNTEALIHHLSVALQVKNVGEDIESASAFKLLFAMVNKAMCGLFFETMLAASHYGFLEELNDELQDFLPGTYQDLIKTSTTYPKHIKRRIPEMTELQEMLEGENLEANFAKSTKRILKIVDESGIMEGKNPKTVREVFSYFNEIKPKE